MNPELVCEAQQLLAEASVVGESPGSSFIPFGDHVHGSKEPSGDSWALADRMKRRFDSCATDRDLERAVTWAKGELKKWRKGQGYKVWNTEKERDNHIIKQYVGDPPEKVAECESIHRSHVAKLRWENGRSPKDGRPIQKAKMVLATKEERAARAKELRDQMGLSARQIAIEFGVSHVTVLDDLKDAA